MANPTTNLSIVLPEPGAEASRGTWGTTVNDAFQDLDTVITARSMPTGGTDNQVLTKDGNLVDYQTEWSDRLSSVAVTGSDGIEVDSGSPITSSGTIALGIHKTTLLTFLNAEDGATSDQNATEIKTLLEDGIDSVHYKDGSIDTIHIADDQIDSQHYAAGSIDNEHLANNAVDSDELAAGAIDFAHMSVNSIDSDQYVDLSIDTAHIGNLQVTTGKIVDDAVTEDKLANSINTAIAANTSKVTNATHTGDVTGSTALTLDTSGVSAGTYGSVTTIPVITFDAKGRATTATTAAFTATTEADVVALAIALG